MKNRPCRGFTFWFPFGNARKCRARIAFAFLFVFTFRLAFGRDGVSLIFIRFSCLFHRYYDGFSNERERESKRGNVTKRRMTYVSIGRRRPGRPLRTFNPSVSCFHQWNPFASHILRLAPTTRSVATPSNPVKLSKTQ